MKKILSVLIAAVVFCGQSFAGTAGINEVRSAVQEMADQRMTLAQAMEKVSQYVSPEEARRVEREVRFSIDADSLAQDLPGIISSVKIQNASGSGLHSSAFSTGALIGMSVFFVAIVVVIATGTFGGVGGTTAFGEPISYGPGF